MIIPEYVLQAQNRDWYSFLNRCLDCGGVIRRFDLAINDMCGLLDIPTLSEKYKMAVRIVAVKNYENVQGGKLRGKPQSSKHPSISVQRQAQNSCQ